jgi:hypothetical protein
MNYSGVAIGINTIMTHGLANSIVARDLVDGRRLVQSHLVIRRHQLVQFRCQLTGEKQTPAMVFSCLYPVLRAYDKRS